MMIPEEPLMFVCLFIFIHTVWYNSSPNIYFMSKMNEQSSGHQRFTSQFQKRNQYDEILIGQNTADIYGIMGESNIQKVFKCQLRSPLTVL